MEAEQKSGSDSEMHRRLRGKNRAMLAVLLGLVALIYAVAIVRMKAGSFP